MDFEGIGRVATNTTLAACAAGLTAMAYAYVLSKKWDVSFYRHLQASWRDWWPSPVPVIGLPPTKVRSCSAGIAGVIVVAGVELLEYLRIDDPIGAVPVHGICGIWGTLSLGLFAAGKYGASGPFAPDNSAPLAGLFYGGGTQVLIAQAIWQQRLSLSPLLRRCSPSPDVRAVPYDGRSASPRPARRKTTV